MRRPLPVALTASTLFWLVLLLCGLYAGARPLVLISKPLASLSFIGIALSLGTGDRYGQRILAGLCLGALGDVALMFDRLFLAGLVVFLGGHLLYVLAFVSRCGVAAALRPVSLLVLLFSAAAYAWLWPHLGPMRGPVAAYVLVITAMVAAALALARKEPGWLGLCVGVGAVLFYFSDLSVALNRFVSPRFLHSLWGLPAYYLGQVLLAWSTGLTIRRT